ncbi:hypothetical protein COY16_04130 [Candidatus Roizmanbacteria bacterium CG_4_10_14_0_2_um_filter_39_13]|uniref:Uncharacterized protein n=1 Tax=Candidatus Roizmanbacteria bacterium CG_4_10_14_0_2_um_filter_39_13 TaxID=1974825 RepID=A0A2M7TXC4_9BACT|nr:MAG: hypothetical protein COY16_04130 [Candidatus Roizmanbacteria bacterium CG_4_10_14_0_2_um_filter_39_13]
MCSKKEALLLLEKSATSLFRGNGFTAQDKSRETYDNNKSPLQPPYNEELFPQVIEVIERFPSRYIKPVQYWDNQPYNPHVLIASTIQFFDDHNGPVISDSHPPSCDIQRYMEYVLQSPRPLTVPKQLEQLLIIAKGNICGASHVGYLAHRIGARAADSRLYPDIPFGLSDTSFWTNKMTHFDECDSSASDPAGDAYYFWTQFHASVTLGALPDKISQVYVNILFGNGLKIMTAARNAVNKPITSSHFVASMYGRECGKGTLSFCSEQ